MIYHAHCCPPRHSADEGPRRTIAGLLRALHAHDPHSQDHSSHVRDHAVRVATELGWSRQRCRQVGLAAMLHDIGKLVIPESILNKPGRLTSEEMAEVRQHPAMGVELLSAAIHNQSVLEAIRGHHERFDGSGYPDGLGGESISLEARIIAIADCFDALVSSRPYRLPLPRQVALEMIHDGAGTQFDPCLVRSFLRLNSLSAN